MTFLQDLFITPISEANEDMSALPPDAMKKIQKNIRDGAADTTQKWANALELVHKAYEVAGVQRPTPDMKEGWKQYEENLHYAVQQLANVRGIEGDWRMSASVFHEAAKNMINFHVTMTLPNSDPLTTIVQADHIDKVVENIKKYLKKNPSTEEYEIRVNDEFKGKILTFWLHGIRKNALIKIELD